MRIFAYAASGVALFGAGLTAGYVICRQALSDNVRNLLLLVTHTREDRDRLKDQLAQIRRLQRRSQDRHLRIIQPEPTFGRSVSHD